MGSPPPTRGTLSIRLSSFASLGITPAYAGNTCWLPVLTVWRWDHPRLRGEHSESERREQINKGSPPPTRGTLSSTEDSIGTIGITPAYAGNTHPKSVGRITAGDHPRLRGEHYVSHKLFVKHLGSPPPTRGTPVYQGYPLCSLRITPAYAGNTAKKLPSGNYRWDHPRLRGEHKIFIIHSNAF